MMFTDITNYVYAIIRKEGTAELQLIQEDVYPNNEPTKDELARMHNYAYGLSEAYCSCLPQIEGDPDKEFYLLKESRKTAIALRDTIERIKTKYDVVAHSHRYGGWKSFEWKFNDDIKFRVDTNFGFGSASYFSQCFFYKGIQLAPYAHYVKYRNADYYQIIRYTYSYRLWYSQWNDLLNDALKFYNAIVYKHDDYIFEWLRNHLSKMVDGLEKYVFSYYCYFDNIDYYGRKTYDRVEGDEFWIIKAHKIAESLKFINNIKVLPIQVSPIYYIKRIENLNKAFKPKLLSKIRELRASAIPLKQEMDTITSKPDFQLYKKIKDKFYYKRNWNHSCEKVSMIRFLLGMLHKKHFQLKDVRNRIKNLQKDVEVYDGKERELNSINYVLKNLDESRKYIKDFFQQKRLKS